MKQIILIAVMIVVTACATIGIPPNDEQRSARVYDCVDGTYGLHADVLPVYPLTKYPCELGFKTIEQAFRSEHPKGRIELVQTIEVGGVITNGHTEHLVIYR